MCFLWGGMRVMGLASFTPINLKKIFVGKKMPLKKLIKKEQVKDPLSKSIR